MTLEPSWQVRVCLSLLAVLSVACCATAAQRQAQQAGVTIREAVAQREACTTAVYGKPEYASLVSHTPDIATGRHTMVQLTTETLISPDDAKLFAARYDDSAGCRSRFLNAISTARPDLVPILADSYTKGAALVVRLIERKDTWGGSARQSEALLSDERDRIAAADRQWIADLNASHQAEMAQRQAAAAALMQWSAQQQMINAINRPVVTTCNRFGSSVNCISN